MFQFKTSEYNALNVDNRNIYGDYIYWNVTTTKDPTIPFCWSFITRDECLKKKHLEKKRDRLSKKLNKEL
jgi:hypothetical protein